MTSPHTAAERVIEELRITHVADLAVIEAVAWARGARVQEAKLTGPEAWVVMDGNRGIITVSTGVRDACRRRFSIAHELGHFELHKLLSSVSVCLAEDIEGSSRRGAAGASPLELEANEFASCLLMPERWFVPDCQGHPPSLDLVESLADKYTTSLTATARRYVELCDEAVAVVYSRDGLVRWFQGSPDFMDSRLFIDPKVRLDGQTFAGGHFNGVLLPEAPRLVLAESWLRLKRPQPLATIVEHSRSMPAYNAVLSLLWVKDDLAEDDEYDPDED